ncbi:MAG: acetyl-CoA carboxylase biotin carboxylase subunit family protein [Bacteroidales bacterium]
MMKEKKKIFVVGLDEFNLDKLNNLPGSRECDFLPALRYDEMRGPKKISIPDLINKSDIRIQEAGRIDAVVSFFDFPGSMLVPVIAEKYHIPGPSLESVMKCEHKYWSRIEQQKVIPENVPDFKAFELSDDDSYNKIGLEPPFWIKPVKSYHSFLAYRITGPEQFKECIRKIRDKIDSIVEPFSYVFREYGMSWAISGMKEKMFAEAEASGHQCTIEGYSYGDEIETYGIVDSVRIAGRSSFSHYEYPSSLSEEICDRISDLSKRVIRQIGLNHSAFNIEYFYNEDKDELMLLEINPRISQAHSDIFEKVHGISNHNVMLNMALNRRPDEFTYDGDFKFAAHFMHRTFKSGIVRKVPGKSEIDEMKKKYPDLVIKINVGKGLDLDDMPAAHIDSYSYVLANIFIGAGSRNELVEKYNDIVNNLTFEIEKK